MTHTESTCGYPIGWISYGDAQLIIFRLTTLNIIISAVVLGSESSVNAHSIYQDEHGRNQHYCEVEDDTTTDCYRSEKHKSWTTRSKGGFTTDTGNSDIDIDINTPRTEDMISEPFSPDSFGHGHSVR